jgi:hypothetical protein
MVETYGSDQQRIYYVTEDTFGVTPTNPQMLSLPADQLEPSLEAGLIKLRGTGNYDLQALKKGLRSPNLKISYPLPSAAPVEHLQWVKMDLNKSLTTQIIYHKGTFASPTDTISLLYTGAKINKATVSCSIEDVIRVSEELQALDLTIGTSKISGATYTDHSGAVAFHESYIKKDTASLDRVTDWKFEVANNLKRIPVIRSTNGHLAKYLSFRQRDLTGELTFEFESIQEATETLSDTEFTLEFGLGGTCKATFSSCKWDSTSIPSKIEDLISLRAPFVAKGPLAINAT